MWNRILRKFWVAPKTDAEAGQKQQAWNTFRDTEKIKDHWKKEMKFEEVKEIQQKCQNALRLWGYR